MCNFPSSNFLKVWWGPLNWNGARAQLLGKFGKPSAGTRIIIGGGKSAAVRTDLESCPLVNCTFGMYVPAWENTLGTLPLGKNTVGKYLTSTVGGGSMCPPLFPSYDTNFNIWYIFWQPWRNLKKNCKFSIIFRTRDSQQTKKK